MENKEIDYSKIQYTREWFDKNQAHTIQDNLFFHGMSKPLANQIEIGDHFLIDLIPIFGNGKKRSPTDVEIWEVINSKGKHYCKERGEWFNFQILRRITTGKQFGFPNGYWKLKEELSNGK